MVYCGSCVNLAVALLRTLPLCLFGANSAQLGGFGRVRVISVFCLGSCSSAVSQGTVCVEHTSEIDCKADGITARVCRAQVPDMPPRKRTLLKVIILGDSG